MVVWLETRDPKHISQPTFPSAGCVSLCITHGDSRALRERPYKSLTYMVLLVGTEGLEPPTR